MKCATLDLGTETENEAEEKSDTESSDSETDQAMSLSAAATAGTTSKKTMRLLGHIGKTQVLILVDSGSSGNFANKELASKLQLSVTQLPPMQVTIADGSKMISSEGITNLIWGVQEAKFSTPVRILPIKCYDLILGMDWLETCNGGKMFIDWKRKKMRFMHEGKRITLRGINASNSYCPQISGTELHQLIEHGAVAQLVTLDYREDPVSKMAVPSVIQQVIDTHDHLFQEPQGLPPQRDFDHRIPLIPGAIHVQKRPYRYAPT